MYACVCTYVECVNTRALHKFVTLISVFESVYVKKINNSVRADLHVGLPIHVCHAPQPGTAGLYVFTPTCVPRVELRQQLVSYKNELIHKRLIFQ